MAAPPTRRPGKRSRGSLTSRSTSRPSICSTTGSLLRSPPRTTPSGARRSSRASPCAPPCMATRPRCASSRINPGRTIRWPVPPWSSTTPTLSSPTTRRIPGRSCSGKRPNRKRAWISRPGRATTSSPRCRGPISPSGNSASNSATDLSTPSGSASVPMTFPPVSATPCGTRSRISGSSSCPTPATGGRSTRTRSTSSTSTVCWQAIRWLRPPSSWTTRPFTRCSRSARSSMTSRPGTSSERAKKAHSKRGSRGCDCCTTPSRARPNAAPWWTTWRRGWGPTVTSPGGRQDRRSSPSSSARPRGRRIWSRRTPPRSLAATPTPARSVARSAGRSCRRSRRAPTRSPRWRATPRSSAPSRCGTRTSKVSGFAPTGST